ncbi:MAG: HAD family phosphatase [Muricauda sp.]|jgi:putative hydrolase of the HAD superfamily|nr:HAD family phosphatase [Allomuricauda sp.]MBO6589081.1 HAD family phosphatase [Allomuricauda sp.]MBO6618706.1 HAD family phosphatase [Allomuricauda sp.]MBO6644619.1 HAD family phosphatase [Allomuricauda sp.]MBO6746519.1 HAD family phosphatase [Allomuricauda sp.]MBO6843397.1 HAD family phosphatase [Allomuricauda sp.]
MIKNIILDFGDVLINLDKPATAKAMVQHGFTEITPALEVLFQDYEKGFLGSSDFLDEVASHFPDANRDYLIEAWNSILLDFPEHRLEFIEQLARENQYKMILLSNTNDLHIEHVKEQMGMERFNRFKNAFDVFYLSYEMGMRKPDAEIFDFVLQENRLLAHETFFVDDVAENTASAADLGIKVWNLQVGKEDITQLKSRL